MDRRVVESVFEAMSKRRTRNHLEFPFFSRHAPRSPRLSTRFHRGTAGNRGVLRLGAPRSVCRAKTALRGVSRGFRRSSVRRSTGNSSRKRVPGVNRGDRRRGRFGAASNDEIRGFFGVGPGNRVVLARAGRDESRAAREVSAVRDGAVAAAGVQSSDAAGGGMMG